MRCPKCSSSMQPLPELDFSAHRCDGCGGFWLDDSDIDVKQHAAAVDAIDAKFADASNDGQPYNDIREIDCPNCKSPLIKMIDRTQLSIDYESCPDCRGAFFDAGELKDLSEFTLRERLKVTWETLKTNLK